MAKKILTVVLIGLVPAGYLFAAEPAQMEAFRTAYGKYQEYIENDELEKALPEARNAYELGKAVFGDDHQNIASLAYNYGLSLLDNGEKQDAKRLLKETLKRYEKLYGRNSYELVPVLMDLGKVNIRIFRQDRSAKYFNRALQLTEQQYGEVSVERARQLLDIGVIILNEDQNPKARRYLEPAYETYRQTLGDDDPETGYAAMQLARLEFASRKYHEAKGYLLAALQTFEDPERPDTTLELSTHAYLVSVYEELGESENATRHCIAIGRMSPYDENQDYQPIFREEPNFPYTAKLSGKQGSVDLQFTVDREGIVRNPEVVDGSSLFIGASLKAVKKWRYAPRFVDGKAVDTHGVKTRLTYTYAD